MHIFVPAVLLQGLCKDTEALELLEKSLQHKKEPNTTAYQVNYTRKHQLLVLYIPVQSVTTKLLGRSNILTTSVYCLRRAMADACLHADLAPSASSLQRAPSRCHTEVKRIFGIFDFQSNSQVGVVS